VNEMARVSQRRASRRFRAGLLAGIDRLRLVAELGEFRPDARHVVARLVDDHLRILHAVVTCAGVDPVDERPGVAHHRLGDRMRIVGAGAVGADGGDAASLVDMDARPVEEATQEILRTVPRDAGMAADDVRLRAPIHLLQVDLPLQGVGKIVRAHGAGDDLRLIGRAREAQPRDLPREPAHIGAAREELGVRDVSRRGDPPAIDRRQRGRQGDRDHRDGAAPHAPQAFASAKNPPDCPGLMRSPVARSCRNCGFAAAPARARAAASGGCPRSAIAV
jgi:hypothetical protein